MSDEKTIALVHGEIDGENSPEESSELQTLLAHDAEARDYRDDMKQLDEVLSRVTEAEVPAGLHESILSVIPSRHVSPAVPFQAGKPRTTTLSSGFRLSLALAAGIVLGLFVGTALVDDPGTWDPSDLSGAMMPGSRVTDPVQLEAEGLSATIRGVQNDERLLITFDVMAQTPVEVVLEYDPGKVVLTGFARRGGQFDVVEARGGR